MEQQFWYTFMGGELSFTRAKSPHLFDWVGELLVVHNLLIESRHKGRPGAGSHRIPVVNTAVDRNLCCAGMQTEGSYPLAGWTTYCVVDDDAILAGA